MSEPTTIGELKKWSHVLVWKLTAGRVRVHRARLNGTSQTACGHEAIPWGWAWVELQTLNDDKVLWCKRGCWK